MSIPLAHIAHWYHVLLYLAPILVIGAGLWWSARREAKRERAASARPSVSDER